MKKSKIFKILSATVLMLLSFVMLFSVSACKSSCKGKTTVVPGDEYTAITIVKFETDDFSMIVGDSVYIQAKATASIAGAKVEYKSKNQDIVTISQDGEVNALKKGVGTLVATYGAYSDEIDVTVTHGDLFPELKLNGTTGDTINIAKNVPFALQPAVLFNSKEFDNATFTYSYDKNAVKIDSATGEITGLKKGTTEITISAQWDGFKDIPALTKTYTVEVSNYIEIFINNGKDSSFTIFNKNLPTLKGETKSTDDFVVVAKDEKGIIDNSKVTIEVVQGTDIVSYADGKIIGKGKMGNAVIKITAIDFEGDAHVINVDINVERAVGDYIADGEYKVVDFDTLTGNGLNLAEIFGSNVSIVEAYENGVALGIKDNKIVSGVKGYAFTTPVPTILTIYTETEGYNVKVNPYVVKVSSNYEEELEFSSHDGIFFEKNKISNIYTALTAQDIFGKETKFVKAYLKTNDGETELQVSEDGTQVLGVNSGSVVTNFTLAVTSDTEMKIVSVNAATLIIDEFSDFKYFTVTPGDVSYNYTSSVPFKFTAGMDWSGYYILGNDLYYDKEVYTHMVFTELLASTRWRQPWLSSTDFGDITTANYWEQKGAAGYGVVGRGLTGVFDGNGHVIYNYNPNYQVFDKYLSYDQATGVYTEGMAPTASGLFGMINGGVVKNLGFKNAVPSHYSGVLADNILYGSVIENVYVESDPTIGYNTGWHASVIGAHISATCAFNNIVAVHQSAVTPRAQAGIFGQDNQAHQSFSNVYIVSPLGYHMNADKVDRDAEYVDGVKTPESMPYVKGVKRYTDFYKFMDDAANNSFSSFNNDIWAVLGGSIPMFKSLIKTEELVAFVGGTVANESHPGVVEIDQSNPVTFRTMGLAYANATKLEIISEEVAGSVVIEGHNLVGKKAGTAVVKATYTDTTGVSNVKQFSVLIVPAAQAYEEELILSASNGKFYKLNASTGKYEILALADIFDSETNQILAANDQYGNVLDTSVEGSILGVATDKSALKQCQITIYGTEKSYKINVDAATYVVAEYEDLEYFKIQHRFYRNTRKLTYDSDGNYVRLEEDYALEEEYNALIEEWKEEGVDASAYEGKFRGNPPTTSETSGAGWQYVFAPEDFEFDGYYLLANDIDAEGQTHDVLNGKLTPGQFFKYTSASIDSSYTRYGFADMGDGDLKGLSGTFDGNGKVIKNLRTTYAGLFGSILGGTVKDLAFVDCTSTVDPVYSDGGLISYNVCVGSTFENLFVYNSIERELKNEASSLIGNSSLGSVTMKNVVILDRNMAIANMTAKGTFGSLVGLFEESSSPRGDGTGKFQLTNFQNVYVISDVPLAAKSVIAGSEITPLVEAAYVDGVAQVDDYTSTGVYVANGIKRYTNLSRIAADSANNDYSSFADNLWEIVDGGFMPVAKGYSQLVNPDEFYAIKLNNSFVGAQKVSTLGETFSVSVARGAQAFDGTIAVTSANTSVATVSGNTIKVSKTTAGISTITVLCTKPENAGTITLTFDLIVNEPVVKANDVVVSADGAPLFIGQDTIITLDHEGSTITDFALSTTDTSIVGIDGNKITAKTIGMATIKVTFNTDCSFTFKVGSLSDTPVTYDKEVMFSAIDGVLDLKAITGNENAKVLLATAGEGEEAYDLVVENNGVYGLKTINTGVTETSIVIYTTAGTFKVNLNAYTLIIDEASDFEYFQVKKALVSGGSKTYGFAPGDVEWDGYYILANDIDATGYSHNFHSKNAFGGELNSTALISFVRDNVEGKQAYKKGLTGTFDGNGYTVSNMTIGAADGIFGVINGGTIKNIAFKNTLINASQSTAIATWMTNGATLENVYLNTQEIANTVTVAPYWGSTVLVKAYDQTVKFNGVVIDYPYSVKHYASPWILNLPGDTDDNEETIVDGYVPENNNVIIISPMAPDAGIEFIDSVQYFTSRDAFKNEYIKDNSIVSTFSPEFWSIVDNLITFAPAGANDYKAIIDGKVQNEFFMISGEEKSIILTKGGIPISELPTLTVLGNGTSVTVEGNKFKAAAAGTQNIKVSIGSWSTEITVHVVAAPQTLDTEYLFSAYDGLFFDNNGNVVTLETLFGSSDVVLTRVDDKDGKSLSFDNEDGTVLAVTSSTNTGFEDNVLTLISETKAIKVNVQVATLIIDEAEDMKYFSYTGNYVFEGEDGVTGQYSSINKSEAGLAQSLTSSKDQLVWDGYYYLVSDIDGATANYGSVENPHKMFGNSNVKVDRLIDVQSALKDAARYESIWSNAWTTRGLLGTFDGNGHTIANFTTTHGLFGNMSNATVKNLGIVEVTTTDLTMRRHSLAQTALGETTLENVFFYANTSKAQGLVSSISDQTTMKDVFMYVDSSVGTSQQGPFIGPETVNTHVTTNATFDNVILVSSRALGYDASIKYKWSHFAITQDALTVDGVTKEYTEDNGIKLVSDDKIYNPTTLETTTSTDVGELPYTYALVSGISRWTSLAKINEAYTANADMYNGFNNSNNYWKVIDGMLVFDSALIPMGKVKFYANDTLVGNATSFCPDEELIFSAKLVGEIDAPVNLDFSVEIIEGSEFATLTGKTIKFTDCGTVTVKLTYKNFTKEVDYIIEGASIDEEYIVSAHTSELFDKATNEVVTLSEVLDNSSAVVTVVDGKGNDVWDETNSKLAGLEDSSEGFARNSLKITLEDGSIYKVYIDVATLVIDEAEDMKYFTYTGDYVFSGEDGVTGQYSSINKSEAGLTQNLKSSREQLVWDGYYYLVTDIDGSNDGYGSIDNPHKMFGNSNVVQTRPIDVTTALKDATQYESIWANGWTIRGLLGTFDGNGHTISNFTTTHGLFGNISNATVKNLGIVEVSTTEITYRKSSLAQAALGESAFENIFFYGKDSKSTGLVASVSNQTTLRDVFMYVDNSIVMSQQYPIIGPETVNAHEVSTATFDNVVVVSNRALAYDASIRKGWGHFAITQDALTVDGVAIEYDGTTGVKLATADNLHGINSVDSIQTSTDVGSLPYTYQLQSGVSRYTSLAKINEAYTANADMYNAFDNTNGFWQEFDGMFVFKSAHFGLGNLKFYSNGTLLEEASKNFAVSETVTITASLAGVYEQNEVLIPEIEIISGDQYVTVLDNVITFVASGEVNVKVTANGYSQIITYKCNTVLIDEEYLVSSYDGEIFTKDSNNVITIQEIIGIDEEISAVKDGLGNDVWDETNDKLVGLKSSTSGFEQDCLLIELNNGAIYKVYVDVATLIIDEAIDLKYFSYTGTWTVAQGEEKGYSVSDNTLEKDFANHVNNVENGEINQFNWEGYFYLVKDIDGAATAGSEKEYGTASKPHNIYGNAGVTTFFLNATNLTGKFSIRDLEDADEVGWIDMGASGAYYNVFASGFVNGQRGLTGIFEGNGHTISNLETGLGGLFGFIRDAKVQNLGLDEVGMFASTAIGVNEFTNIYYKSSAEQSSFARSMSRESVITNVYIEVPNFKSQQHAGFSIIGPEDGVYAGDSNYHDENGNVILPSATNLIIVSPFCSTFWKVNWNQLRIYADATMVDGVVTSEKNTVSYRPATMAGGGAIAEYKVTLWSGSTRFTTTAKLAEYANANASIYDGFTSTYWKVENGLLVFGSAN